MPTHSTQQHVLVAVGLQMCSVSVHAVAISTLLVLTHPLRNDKIRGQELLRPRRAQVYRQAPPVCAVHLLLSSGSETSKHCRYVGVPAHV
mmetsp:Transcript_98767/g.247557  ORF Transcript_98767/g.247557 Transcript_98767/m.247557 type:complete len:90 (-) Transcript_98767:50-319(-)